MQQKELYHYGVKGMKWGIRRFRKYDGTLTATGKRRYDDTTIARTKSKHRLALESKYRKQGMSPKDAELAANKRIRTEKILMAASAMTLTAAATYVAHKHIKIRADGLIKAGGTLQRVEMQKIDKVHDSFYAAANKRDKIKYAGKLGLTRQMQTGESYIMKLGVQKDIKIAGNDTAQKTFEKLYRTDVDFRKAAEDLSYKNVHGGNKVLAGVNNMTKRDVKKMYENFNTNLIQHDHPAVQKFYKELKSAGYGAVRDVNDMKYSGYKAKNPLIIFGSSDSIMVKSVSELSQGEAVKKYIQDGMIESTEQLAMAATAGIPVATLMQYANDYKVEDRNQR